MSGSKWDSQPRASRGRHDYTAADALPLQCAAIRAEFAAQPPARQRETLDRVLALLVDELRRREAGHQRQYSALWRSITPTRLRFGGHSGRCTRRPAKGG